VGTAVKEDLAGRFIRFDLNLLFCLVSCVSSVFSRVPPLCSPLPISKASPSILSFSSLVSN